MSFIKFIDYHKNQKVDFGLEQHENQHVYYLKDNGTRIKYADRLFKPFERQHEDKDFKDIGLGLSIAKKIIDLHGDTIWAEGEVENGATFYFTLPQKEK